MAGMTVTLINLKGEQGRIEVPEWQSISPPLFVRRADKVYLVESLDWVAGTQTTPVIATFKEQPPQEALNLSHHHLQKIQPREQAA